jgi:hypothetical protein
MADHAQRSADRSLSGLHQNADRLSANFNQGQDRAQDDFHRTADRQQKKQDAKAQLTALIQRNATPE